MHTSFDPQKPTLSPFASPPHSQVTLLAKVAKLFNVPAILTAVETESFSGYIWPQLLDIFEGQDVIERTSMNSWDDEGFRAAIKATGKKNIIMTGLWTEVCVSKYKKNNRS